MPTADPTTPAIGDEIEVELEQPVAGGVVLARPPDGPIVLARGGLPGERVVVRLDRIAKTRREGTVTRVVTPSVQRREPPCPHVAERCGGCDLQHADPAAQVELKRAVAVDALRRLGGVAEPQVRVADPLPATGYRTTVRGVVRVDGRFGFRAAHSHDAVAADGCLTSHPLVRELIDEGRFGEASEVTIRVGAGTGERLVVVGPSVGEVVVPDDVRVVGDDELRAGRRAWLHEIVDGRTYRVSARSFFQSRPDGAAALVAEVRRHLHADATSGTVIDAYAGVGLFAAALAADGREVTAVERNRSSLADARVNLSGTSARAVAVDIEQWRPTKAAAVVADPSRSGLGRRAVDVLAATTAPVLVLVSCDPAALGRDTKLLAAAGYDLEDSVLVDLFPQTHHLEVVSRFVRR